MLFKDILDLISTEITIDDVGDQVETTTSKEIFCDKRSISQSEFYQSQATGLKPEIKFIIRYEDYDNHKKIRYDNRFYDVSRTYSKEEEYIELVCGGGINGTT